MHVIPTVLAIEFELYFCVCVCVLKNINSNGRRRCVKGRDTACYFQVQRVRYIPQNC